MYVYVCACVCVCNMGACVCANTTIYEGDATSEGGDNEEEDYAHRRPRKRS